jgi:hypothetical protein
MIRHLPNNSYTSGGGNGYSIRPGCGTYRLLCRCYVAAILMAIYGLGLLLFPQAMFTLSQDPGVPANPGWTRQHPGTKKTDLARKVLVDAGERSFVS